MRSRTPSLAVLALAAALPAAAQDLTIVSKATHDGGPPVTTMGGMTKTEECLTSDLALPAQSWDTFRDYADSFKTMTANMGPMSQGMADMQAKMKAMKGFPLARKTTVSVLGRTTTSSTEVVE